MNKKHTTRLLLLIFGLLLIIPMCTSRTSNYNFGIKISEQPQYFSEHYAGRNPREYAPHFKNINVYRQSLEIDLHHNKDYPIEIEFLVDAIDYDIKVYPAIDSEEYLLTTMIVGFTNQVQITQNIEIGGKKLDHVAKYICIYNKEKNYYVPTPVSDNAFLSHEKKYRVVFVYKFPKGTYLKDFRKFWFKKGNLDVEFKLKESEEMNEKLDFKLHWYRRSAMWERILSIT